MKAVLLQLAPLLFQSVAHLDMYPDLVKLKSVEVHLARLIVVMQVIFDSESVDRGQARKNSAECQTQFFVLRRAAEGWPTWLQAFDSPPQGVEFRKIRFSRLKLLERGVERSHVVFVVLYFKMTRINPALVVLMRSRQRRLICL